jgi:hypothetical protein
LNFTPIDSKSTWTRQKWLSNLNWIELKISSFFSFNLSYIDWISVFLLFYTIRFPSAILCRQMMKAQIVSCFGDCSNSLIRISLFHWSNPKWSRRFSLLISLTMFINLKAYLLTNDRECPIEAVFYFERIRSEIQRNFQSTLLSLIPKRFGVSVNSLHFILFSFDNDPLTCNLNDKSNNCTIAWQYNGVFKYFMCPIVISIWAFLEWFVWIHVFSKSLVNLKSKEKQKRILN